MNHTLLSTMAQYLYLKCFFFGACLALKVAGGDTCLESSSLGHIVFVFICFFFRLTGGSHSQSAARWTPTSSTP